MSSASLLQELHRLHRYAHELKSQIDRAPRQLKAQQDKVEREQQALTKAQDGVKKLKVTLLEKESDLKAKQQDVAKHEQQRNQATSKKEYDALQIEIARGKNECQAIEDEILAAMMNVDEGMAQIPTLDESVKKAREEVTRVQQEFEPRLKSLKEQHEQARQQLNEQASKLAPEDVEQYERLVTARGEDALARVEKRNCMACHSSITIQNLNDLQAGRMVLCKTCGRILYVQEAAPAGAAG
jgi:predicted  nucleic acid-binding Zn-ribbon protein